MSCRGLHWAALAATYVDYCCEHRDSPRIILSPSVSVSATAWISRGRRNRSPPSVRTAARWSCRLGFAPDGRQCTEPPWRSVRTCPWSYPRDTRSNCPPCEEFPDARWCQPARPTAVAKGKGKIKERPACIALRAQKRLREWTFGT